MSGQEKTEEPTAHRLRRARAEGDVAPAADFVAAVVTLGGVGVLLVLAPTLVAALEAATVETIRLATAPKPDAETLRRAALAVLSAAAAVSAPFLLVALLAAPLATAIAHRGLPLRPPSLRLQALSPAANLSRLVSAPHLLQVLWALVRAGVAATALAVVLMSEADTLLAGLRCGLGCASLLTLEAARALATPILAATLVIACLDLWLQRRLHRAKLRMTKEEVKREHREQEGDPLFKSLRQRQGRAEAALDVAEAIAASLLVLRDGEGRAVGVWQGIDQGKRVTIVTLAAAGPLAARLEAAARADGRKVALDPSLMRALWGFSGAGLVTSEPLAEAVATRLPRT